MNIEFYLAAKDQLDDIYGFIANESPTSAVKVYYGILDEIERLASFPQIAKIEENLNGLASEFRSLVVLRIPKPLSSYFIFGCPYVSGYRLLALLL